MNAERAIKLSQSERRFILHWGEMGTRWGISRVVAQVHALLLVHPTPLDAQEISETLDVARSNISVALRELQSWGLCTVVHVMGDRRDRFQTNADIEQMFLTIVDKRIEREILPTLELLRTLKAEQPKENHFSHLLTSLLETFERGVSFYRRVRALPVAAIKRLLALDRGISKLLGA